MACDHLGSSALELDGLALLVSREGYYPFGGTAWFAARSETEAKYKTIRYSGKERDVSGLFYYGFRYYVCWWLRWLNPDPAGAVDGLNLYRMVGNNPVSYKDQDGLLKTPSEPPPIPDRPSSSVRSCAPPVPFRPDQPSRGKGIASSSAPAVSSSVAVPEDLAQPHTRIKVGDSPLVLTKIKDVSSSFETWLMKHTETDWLILKDYSSMVALDEHGLAKQRQGASNEVFAFRFSEKLELHIVPATELQPGEDRHALSRFVGPAPEKVSFDRQQSSMYVFDFLLNTRDRIDDGQHGNIVFDRAGKAFAIDHDQILESGYSAIAPDQITDAHLSFFASGPLTKERLINSDWGAFFDEHVFRDPLIDRMQAREEFLGRIDFIRNRLR